jgi:hypothetical protein
VPRRRAGLRRFRRLGAERLSRVEYAKDRKRLDFSCIGASLRGGTILGRSGNRRSEIRNRVFQTCPWGFEGKSESYCYECHEVLLHNPVILPDDVAASARLVASRGLDETEKPPDHTKLAGRIKLSMM